MEKIRENARLPADLRAFCHRVATGASRAERGDLRVTTRVTGTLTDARSCR